MKMYSGFALACVLLVTAAGIVAAPCAHAEQRELLESNSSAQSGGQENNAPLSSGVQSGSSIPGSRTAAVLRFAVEWQPMTDTPALSTQACPQSSAAASPTTATSSTIFTVDTRTPKILDEISWELQSKLSKGDRILVLIEPDPAEIPVGALVISGCITKEDGGHAATRLIGMNVGASHLGVHVVVPSRTKDGWSPIDTFDIKVKGGNVVPPVGPAGLAVNAARDTQQTLSADAKKVADRIAKRFSQDVKAREQPAKNN